MSSPSAQSVLDYWFEPGKSSRWFFAGKEVDNEIREKFGDLVLKARNGELSSWENLEEGDKSGLAFVILIDQFCRNIYRGTKDMYSHDHKSLAVALKMIENENHKKLATAERLFLYLPLEHHEDKEMQAKCVALNQEVVDELKNNDGPDKKMAEEALHFAKKHQVQIEKYGRFPKRNSILGRENTPQETEDLKNWTDAF